MTWKKMMPGCEIYRAILPLHHLTSVTDYISRKKLYLCILLGVKIMAANGGGQAPFWSSQSQESSFAAISWTTPQKLYLAVKCQIHCIILLTSSNGKRCQNLVANFKSVTVTFQAKFFNRFLVRTFPRKTFSDVWMHFRDSIQTNTHSLHMTSPKNKLCFDKAQIKEEESRNPFVDVRNPSWWVHSVAGLIYGGHPTGPV